MTKKQVLRLCKKEIKDYLKENCYGLAEDMINVCRAIDYDDANYIYRNNFILRLDNFRREKMDKIRDYLLKIVLNKNRFIIEK